MLEYKRNSFVVRVIENNFVAGRSLVLIECFVVPAVGMWESASGLRESEYSWLGAGILAEAQIEAQQRRRRVEEAFQLVYHMCPK